MTDTQPLGAIPAWDLPDRLAKARHYARLDQIDLAAALGISVRSVKRYEAGEPIKRGLLLGWAFATAVDPNWLEHGDTGADGGGHSIRYSDVRAA